MDAIVDLNFGVGCWMVVLLQWLKKEDSAISHIVSSLAICAFLPNCYSLSNLLLAYLPTHLSTW